jgi:transposase
VEESTYELIVGIDWATEAHEVCILRSSGEEVEKRVVVHSGEAVAAFLEKVVQRVNGASEQVAVAIEVPRGPLVEMMLERGFHVFALNPKQLDRFRDRYFPSGSKDDRRDAFVLAQSLRTDRHCFHRVQATEAVLLRLRELSRLDGDLKKSFQQYCSQLRELLYRYYPQLLALCPTADEPWIWKLLEIAPTPEKGARLKLPRVTKVLKEYQIRRLQPEQVVERLRSPGFKLLPGTVEAVSERAVVLIPHVRLLRQQQLQLARQLKTIFDDMTRDGSETQHHDAKIILSLPGVGYVIAATMLAEASQPLASRDYYVLRAYAGVAPITRQSGKTTAISMRHACNGRLRDAVYHWARISVQHDPRSLAQYSRLRSAGHNYSRTLRGVSDRLLALLCAMLRDQKPFDPELRNRKQERA